ncbi:RNA polymerase sigma-54 factor [Phyllobacterium phragmitis]|uniref:RNA polymerase sigma-54 factor n=1 Tax=Phyllobacterium phragmitis TaxID=2670329 RepID=A0A2S9IS55_9HYPH|nr:RNA polymerase factor sigma-54 [Phyllobacterium phragmitis]PRD43361.1 RNA polymerase sigma-54 factor [Phyllobacterium phragmitis]
MALSPKLDLRQSQSLVMTPQLMQSIRLLQMNHIELEHFIDLEIEKNPLLERVDPANDDVASESRDTPDGESRHSDSRDDSSADPTGDADGFAFDGGHAASEREEGLDWLDDRGTPDSGAISETFDTSMENIFPDDPGRYEQIAPDLASQWKSSGGDGYICGGGEGFDIEQVTASRVSLRDRVDEQILFAFRDPAKRLIAAELADHLDDMGYLRADLHEIAERLVTEPLHLEEVLAVLQTFEPAGLFARDLAECLAIQLRQKDRFDPAMQALVANLQLLAKRDFQTLKRLCGVDQSDLLDMLTEIRLLDPKPGTLFAVGVANAIVPDVNVMPAHGGGWEIELNAAALPRVLVNQEYYIMVARGAGPQDKDFLSECLQNANWLTRSLDQRARTILKVAREIVRQQDGFLMNGISQLKPLNLRMVADAIGMHESTVSRVTANKYMLTSRGVFELRYFFNAAIASAEGGDAHSSEAVRHQIRQLIDRESPDSILSDDAIVDILNRDGVDIARRTVAKYRESMSIPSSIQRRREKKAIAASAR